MSFLSALALSAPRVSVPAALAWRVWCWEMVCRALYRARHGFLGTQRGWPLAWGVSFTSRAPRPLPAPGREAAG